MSHLLPRARGWVQPGGLSCPGLLHPGKRERKRKLLELPQTSRPRHRHQGLLLFAVLVRDITFPRKEVRFPCSSAWGAAGERGAWPGGRLQMKLPSPLCSAAREKCSSEIIPFFFSSLEALPVNQKIYDCFKEF